MGQTPIALVTSHAGKAKQVAQYLDYPIVHKKLDINEIQSLDPVEVVTEKVQEAYRQVQEPVLVEDVAVIFNALGRLPGTYFKAFLEELKLDELCRLLDNYKSRAATVIVNYAFFDGTTLKVFGASIEGTIAEQPRGKATFGSDAIFIPKGFSKTWSEMDKEELAATSITSKALGDLRIFLEQYQKN